MHRKRTELLEHMHRADFFDAVERAERETAEKIASRDTLRVWAARIRPYLDADAELTIAEAIDRYKREHGVPPDERA